MFASVLTKPQQTATDRGERGASPFGIYLHIPFCVSKCSYCAFSSIRATHGLLEEYLEAVHEELDAYAESGAFAGRIADTVYFGGGTPSLASPDQIATLIGHIRRAFPLAERTEITLEANPETVSYDKFRGFVEAGITRISLGVQSLQAHVLRALRRAHTPQRVFQAYDDARRAGCGNLNLDLIYGIPGQSRSDWAVTLETVFRMGPDHLSAYALTPEPGTVLGTEVVEERVALPDDEEIRAQERLLQAALERNGFHRYEISNYARPGTACRHNRHYWSGDDWLGLGASAHSHLAGHRWWNWFDPIRYLTASRDRAWVEAHESLRPEQRMAEGLAFGLRMVDGVDTEILRERTGVDPWDRYGAVIGRLIEFGLATHAGGSVRLTEFGLAHADTVAASFFEWTA